LARHLASRTHLDHGVRVVSSRTVAVATLLALAYLMLRAVPLILGV
jgi:hypothetical protein